MSLLVLALGCVLAGAVVSLPTAQSVVIPCRSNGSCSDFNGDGFDDAVVGNPYATVNGRAEAGSVTVLFGDADGRIGEGVRRVLTQADGGSRPEAGDHFGWSVSVADVDQDQLAEVLVGSPGEDAPAGADAGIAQILQFTPDAEGGPGVPSGHTFTQAGFHGPVEAGDQFGYAVALASNRGRDTSISFIGAPGEDLDGVSDAGAVYGISIQSTVNVDISFEVAQGQNEFPGVPQDGDRFGATLVEADRGVNPLGAESILIGAPGDEVNGQDGAGSVTVATIEDATIDQGAPRRILTQDTPDVPGVAEAGDGFGTSIAVGNVRPASTGTGAAQFAIGSPGEDIDGVVDAGMVNLFDSVDDSLRPVGSLDQNVAGLGKAEAGDRFGQSVGIRPVNGLLAIGVPGEDVGAVTDGGAVSFANGVLDAAEGRRTVILDTAGIPGTARSGDRFGTSVAGLSGLRESVMAIGNPRRTGGSVVLFSDQAIPIRAWTSGSGGVAPAVRFGTALSGLSAR